MKSLATDYPIEDLAWAMDVSRSGYYRWLKAPESKRSEASRQLTEHIHRIHLESRKCYGSPRVYRELRRQGIATSENRVARLMKAAGIKARCKRAFRPRTTDSNHSNPIAPNRLKSEPPATAPDQIWVADITYVWTMEGWIYLAAVMDLFSRKIVGWALSQTMETSLVKEALERAQKERRPQPGLLHHSDRGSQYASSAFRALLHSLQIQPSMSGPACCYDNAAMESFWSTLKTELIHQTSFRNIQQARMAIFDYLQTFYNPKRLHSALGYQSPVDFELQNIYNRTQLHHCP
jgi:transposase InsO family protein